MTRLAHVFGSERVDDEGAKSLRVKAGDVDTVTASQFGPPGDDSPPLPGDVAVIAEGDGTDDDAIVGYVDPRNAGVALPGERRFTARNEDGEVVGAIYMRRDGTIAIGLNATGRASVAGLVDAEFQRIYDAFANWVPAPGATDGGAAIAAQIKTIMSTAAGSRQTVASETVSVQP